MLKSTPDLASRHVNGIMTTESNFMTSIKKTTLAGLCVLAALGGASNANATVFSASAAFTDSSNSNDLTVVAIPNPATLTTTNLTAGGSYYDTGFMALLTHDSAGGGCFGFCGIATTDQIDLTFTWSAPSSAANTVVGGTVTETTFAVASFDNGALSWAGATNHDSNGYYAEDKVTFADGAVADLDVYNSYITGTTSAEAAQFDVRVVDVKGPVPEPASMALLGAGMIGTGVMARRRRASTKTPTAN